MFEMWEHKNLLRPKINTLKILEYKVYNIMYRKTLDFAITKN